MYLSIDIKHSQMPTTTQLDLSKVSNCQVAGIDHRDYPDYCDAYIEEAEYDGQPMTDEQLEELNDDQDFVYQKVIDHIF